MVDRVLKGGKVVNLFTGEIEELDVAIDKGTIAGWNGYKGKEVIHVKGLYLLPGFIDAHLHIESTLMTPPEFARAVVPRGTTTVIADPHEIANVMGVKGIRYMIKSSRDIPLNLYIMLPSCVPSSPLETAGARIEAEDLEELLSEERVIGLGEVMDVAGVLSGREDLLKKLSLFQGRPVDGHAPSLRGKDLDRYISRGIYTDHETTSEEEGLEKLEKGVFLLIREGTTEKDLKTLIPLIKRETERRLAFVSDDRSPSDLVEEGHMDGILRKAIDEGVDPLVALRMVTLNPAEFYRLKGIGAIAPGYRADIVVLPDLKRFKPIMVIKDGEVVARDGVPLWERKGYPCPWEGMKIEIKNIDVMAEGELLRAIEVIPDSILTRERIVRAKIQDGKAISDPDRDLLKAVVFERHRATGNRGIGFVMGFGLRKGAIASSIAHDAHNLVVVGVDDRDILLAAKKVTDMKGGLTVVAEGRTLASLPLPVAGLMSYEPVETLSAMHKGLIDTTRHLGCKLPDPFMSLSFLSLPVVPKLRITDKGLVDGEEGQIVPLFVKEGL